MFDLIAVACIVVLCTGVLLYAVGDTRWDFISVSALWGLLHVSAIDRSVDDSETE